MKFQIREKKVNVAAHAATEKVVISILNFAYEYDSLISEESSEKQNENAVSVNSETGEGNIFEEDDKEISEDSHHLVYITLRSILQIQPKQEKTTKKSILKNLLKSNGKKNH